MWFLRSAFVCAVDLFFLISGYFMWQKKVVSLLKPVQLLFQVIFFNLAFYLFGVIVGNYVFSIKTLFANMIPSNYFVILYCTVFILSPYTNKLLNQMHRSEMLRFVYIIFILFSIWPTLVDILSEFRGQEFLGLSTIGLYGSQYGYTIINFLMIYIIGAALNYLDIDNIKNSMLLITLLLCVFLIMGWGVLDDKMGYAEMPTALSYCNPVVVLEAIIVFIIFLKKKYYNSHINRLARGTITVFLTHSHMLKYLRIEDYVNGPFLLIHIVLSVAGIYFIGIMIDWLYHLAVDPMFAILEKRIAFPKISVEQ